MPVSPDQIDAALLAIVELQAEGEADAARAVAEALAKKLKGQEGEA